MPISKWIALPLALVTAAALASNVEAAPSADAQTTAPKSTKTTRTTKSPSSPKGKTTSGGEASNKGQKTKGTTTTANNSSTKAKKNATTNTTWEPTNAVSEKLVGKPNQLARAKAVLPAGTDINDATAGFKNFGQFNAAVNASQNLGIEFADLKSAMTGITLEGEKTNGPIKSLGQAIQQFKPGVDADAEAARATSQAAQ